MNGFIFGCAACFVLVFSFITGWVSAHEEIARECVRQGGFYFQKQDFICRQKDAS